MKVKFLGSKVATGTFGGFKLMDYKSDTLPQHAPQHNGGITQYSTTLINKVLSKHI